MTQPSAWLLSEPESNLLELQCIYLNLFIIHLATNNSRVIFKCMLKKQCTCLKRYTVNLDLPTVQLAVSVNSSTEIIRLMEALKSPDWYV